MKQEQTDGLKTVHCTVFVAATRCDRPFESRSGSSATEKKKPFGFFRWRREWDSNPRDRKVKRFSRPPRYDRFDIPPYLIVKYHYTARVFAGDCIQPKYSITSAPDCQYFFENALGELVGLSMICYTEAQKIIESSFGRIPVKRAHGKVIVIAKMNRKLRLKVAE